MCAKHDGTNWQYCRGEITTISTDGEAFIAYFRVRFYANFINQLLIYSTLLMNNLDDGIEIAYNSTGVIAHLCADGEANWNASVGEEVEGDEELQWHNVQVS